MGPVYNLPMTDTTPASIALREMGINHREFVHDGPITSIEQAAAERNQEVSQVVRSILFRLREDEYALALIAGPRQISWKALRRHFGLSRLTMASPEEVLQKTGYEIGAVSPFGLPMPIRKVLDKNVLAQTAVSLGSGVRGTAILMTTKDLLAALGPVEKGEFGAPR